AAAFRAFGDVDVEAFAHELGEGGVLRGAAAISVLAACEAALALSLGGGAAVEGDDGVARFGVRGESAGVEDLVFARPRDEGDEAEGEPFGGEREVGGSVAPWGLGAGA